MTHWLTLNELQYQVNTWSRANFGDQPAYRPLLGVSEECGELCHAFLKQEQNIRMDEDHKAQMADAVGDIVIYLLDFCARSGLSLEECLRDAWTVVQQRDWTKP